MSGAYAVIGGGQSQELAGRIARRLKADHIKTTAKVFPDGERKITLSSVPDKDATAVVVQSTYPPVDSSLLEAVSLIHEARKGGSRVFAAIPYMGYARQDREFLAGEIVTMGVVAKMLRSVGASRVFVVDIHSKDALKQLGQAGRNVSAVQELARYIKRRLGAVDPVIVSPDAGGRDRAEWLARRFGSGFIALEKRRDRKTGSVKITSAGTDEVRGRDLILVDDVISTGGSIVKSAKFLKRQGCGRIFVACTHALLVGGAEGKIMRAGVSEIISTNTVPGSTSVVDVSGPIADAIRHD